VEFDIEAQFCEEERAEMKREREEHSAMMKKIVEDFAQEEGSWRCQCGEMNDEYMLWCRKCEIEKPRSKKGEGDEVTGNG